MLITKTNSKREFFFLFIEKKGKVQLTSLQLSGLKYVEYKGEGLN